MLMTDRWMLPAWHSLRLGRSTSPASVRPTRQGRRRRCLAEHERRRSALKATYFPSSVARPGLGQAKQITPVVLVHDYKGHAGMFRRSPRNCKPGQGWRNAIGLPQS